MSAWTNAGVVKAAKAHAIACYPEESCGIVAGGRYLRMENHAAPVDEHVETTECRCRLCAFEIDPTAMLDHEIEALIHSHPGGPYSPSAADMQSQIAMRVPWGIVPCDLDRAADIIWFGDQLPIAPLIGRGFIHGVHDCFTLIRDVYRTGKDRLRADGITEDWPFDPIVFDDVPRSDGWWLTELDLYSDLFESRGFHSVDHEDRRAGDVFLAIVQHVENGRVVGDKLNHGGVYIGGGLILDHRPARLSRREPMNIWARTSQRWVRYGGAET